MLFEVTHTTDFAYSQPVFLEPHSVRLRPREDGWQKLLDFDMRVEPRPVGVSSYIDLDGNVISSVWFDDLHESLSITTTFTAETFHTNPFDFILDPGAPLHKKRWRDSLRRLAGTRCSFLVSSPGVFRKGMSLSYGYGVIRGRRR